QPPPLQNPHEDFEQVTQVAPQNVVASGVSQAFPFGSDTALFGNGRQSLAVLILTNAGLLNGLLGSVGPGAITAPPGLGGLSSLLSSGSVTPEQVSQILPPRFSRSRR